MNPVIYKLVDLALTAVAVGIEREAILGKVAEMQSAGATPDELADALRKMRDAAIAEAQAKVDAA